MMKRLVFLMIFLASMANGYAQTTISRVNDILDAPMTNAGLYMDSVILRKAKQWLSETHLDSLEQNKIPRIVTMGLVLNGNVSNFLITRKEEGKYHTASSYLRAGVEFGGFMDFLVFRHFAVQARLVFTAEQNQFGMEKTKKHLWTFGIDVPILFLCRLGNLNKGYLNVGAGIYAHFTFASNEGIYHNTESDVTEKQAQPFYVVLHDNHAGVIAHLGYEFPFGMQINFNYLISLSDIFGYYKTTKGTTEGAYAFYPQRISLGVAYRWKNK